MSDILDDFIFDSREQLENAGAQLLALEKEPNSLPSINALMGILHTIKGNSGFVNLRHLYELLHSAESLLQTARETPEHSLQPKVIETLFQVLDTVEVIMGRLENGEDDEVDWMGSLNETLCMVTKELEGTAPQEGEAPQAPTGSVSSAPSAERAKPKVLAQPIKPAAPGELKTQVRRGTKGKPKERELASAEAPAEAKADPIYQGEKPSFASTDSISYLALSDGLLSQEGESLLTDAKNRKDNLGVIFDLRSVGYISSDDIKQIEKFHQSFGDKLALVLDKEDCPDLFRVFQVLDMDTSCRFYPEESAAKAALKNGA
ncbi:MAG: Hpt domain-containing protein [Deltaproteobacteria bacterium]|nr:Hpt domain-containing protein [Deltaproteobacteria bacterium]